MARSQRIYRQLPLLPQTWKKLDRIRARSDLPWAVASRQSVLEEIINRLPEDYRL